MTIDDISPQEKQSIDGTLDVLAAVPGSDQPGYLIGVVAAFGVSQGMAQATGSKRTVRALQMLREAINQTLDEARAQVEEEQAEEAQADSSTEAGS